jgi:putative thioredoxin
MEPIIGTPQADDAAAVPGDTPIKDTTTATFAADVLDASMQVPVLVDFWAPWCGPCKQLTPMLEKVVRGAGGKVRMVKLNIDEHPEVPQQLRIQSIPAVFAFRNGQPVDGFVGALPESQVKNFIDRLVRMGGGEGLGPSPVEQAAEMAKQAFESGDVDAAAQLYGQILQHEVDNTAAIAGLARCHLARNNPDQARAILEKVPADKAGDAEVQAARSALELAEQTHAGDGAEMAALLAKVEADPKDHQARYDLALALYGAGQAETAVDHLLQIVQKARAWNDEAARKQLIKIFEALGPKHEVTLSGRRRLSSILFA